MAAYRDAWPRFQAAGANLVAISVDRPEESAALRERLGLPFALLCDVDKALITRWGALNAKKRGGVAYPSSWILDRDLVVRMRVLERTRARADPGPILEVIEGRRSAGEVAVREMIRPDVGASIRWVADAAARLARGEEI